MVRAAVPTFELLITVDLLRGLIERRAITPDVPARAFLRTELQALGARPVLGASAAQQITDRLLAALTAEDRQQVAVARAAADRRAQQLASRARFAAPDGPASPLLIRYSLIVPGGQRVAGQLAQRPGFNPFAGGEPNAAVLQRLLGVLAP